MATKNAEKALSILRDWSNFQWILIPLLLVVLYIYAQEYKKKNWNGIAAGLTYMLLDISGEVGNSLFFYVTQYAPLWATPGGTSFQVLIGLNIELLFMFSLMGLVTSKLIPEQKDKKYHGVNNRIIAAGVFAVFSLLIEISLNVIGALTWDYWFWSAWCPLVIFGYFSFFLITFRIHDIEDTSKKFKLVGIIAMISLIPLVVFIGLGII